MPEQLIMDAYSSIGTLTLCRGLKLLHLKQSASIGRANWIGGSLPAAKNTMHTSRTDSLTSSSESTPRSPTVISSTARNRVTIGAFCTFAGSRSQILSHSIDLVSCRPVLRSHHRSGITPSSGTDCVILGGSSLPDHSILGAKSLLKQVVIPSPIVSTLESGSSGETSCGRHGVFNRQTGFVA